jgi:hypothetical protein
MFSKLIARSGSELMQEKQKDYRNVVINQIVIIILGLTLAEFILADRKLHRVNSSLRYFHFLAHCIRFCCGTCYETLPKTNS